MWVHFADVTTVIYPAMWKNVAQNLYFWEFILQKQFSNLTKAFSYMHMVFHCSIKSYSKKKQLKYSELRHGYCLESITIMKLY